MWEVYYYQHPFKPKSLTIINTFDIKDEAITYVIDKMYYNGCRLFIREKDAKYNQLA